MAAMIFSPQATVSSLLSLDATQRHKKRIPFLFSVCYF
jgi:hypothetical protein